MEGIIEETACRFSQVLGISRDEARKDAGLNDNVLLYEKSPVFLRELYTDGSRLRFGVQVGDGWVLPVRDLCASIEQLNRMCRKSKAVTIDIFHDRGALHVLYRKEGEKNNDKFFRRVDAVIEAAVSRCSSLCEICGAPAVNRSGDSIRGRLCERHLSADSKWGESSFTCEPERRKTDEASSEHTINRKVCDNDGACMGMVTG